MYNKMYPRTVRRWRISIGRESNKPHLKMQKIFSLLENREIRLKTIIFLFNIYSTILIFMQIFFLYLKMEDTQIFENGKW